MIFVQPFCNDFLTTFSLIFTLCFYSLFSFFSLYYFLPIEIKEMEFVMKIVTNSCSYIIALKNKNGWGGSIGKSVSKVEITLKV